MTAGTQQQQLVADLSREVVARIAPQELPVFRAHSRAYFADQGQVLRGGQGQDEMLGFGVGEAVAFLTPVVLPVMTAVVQYLTVEVTKSARAEGATLIGERVKQLFKRFRPAEATGEYGHAASPPVLTQEQLGQVRQVAFEKALQLKLSAERAGLLADAVVGNLATAAT